MTLTEFYAAVGGDRDDAVGRMQSETLVVRLLRMLPGDGSMSALTAAMERGSAAEAFRAVHTLKGIALNLSLTALADACSVMTEALRGRDFVPEDAGALYGAVSLQYARVMSALAKLEDAR